MKDEKFMFLEKSKNNKNGRQMIFTPFYFPMIYVSSVAFSSPSYIIYTPPERRGKDARTTLTHT